MSALVVIAGPTGVGKSEVAIALASRVGGEIVNYDSVQIYRGFDIGSAKPDAIQRQRVPHHLVDIVDATEPFDAAEFATRAGAICDRLLAEGKVPILVGGTGFYLRALLGELPDLPGRNDAIRERIQAIWQRTGGPRWLFRMLSKVDPVTAGRISERDRHRVERALEVWLQAGTPISSWSRPSPLSVRYVARKFALSVDRSELVRRLDQRVDRMYDAGLEDEVRRLLQTVPAAARAFQSIGYREAAACVTGSMTLEDAKHETRRRTRAYAKRQMTWLRREPDIEWIDASSGPAKATDRIEAALGRVHGQP
jgi:tRNA dimethylallyltransferase